MTQPMIQKLIKPLTTIMTRIGILLKTKVLIPFGMYVLYIYIYISFIRFSALDLCTVISILFVCHPVIRNIFCPQRVCICLCLCVSAPRLVMTSSVIRTPYDWLNKFYSFYVTAIVVIVSNCGFTIEVHRRNQPIIRVS